MATNASVVEQAYAAYWRGDMDFFLSLLDDDIDWRVPNTLPQGGSFRGKAPLGNYFATIAGAWDPIHLNVEGVSEVGDELVVSVVRADGTRRGGDPIGYGAVHVFTVRAGKIVRFQEFTDLDTPLD
jgi:ketosteroid isomerase-like protein